MAQALELPDCWGIDCTTKITAARAKAIKAARIKLDGGEHPIAFLARYGPLPGNPRGEDLDVEEVKVLEDEGLPFFVIQHCRGGSWMASKDRGAGDGVFLAKFVTDLGVAQTVCLGLDLESVRNPGQPVFDHATAWAVPIAGAMYSPTDYIGFDSGLSADQHFELTAFHRYWGAAGSWNVAKRGLCCRQYPTMTLPGLDFPVDPDRAFADLMHGRLLVHCPEGFTFAPKAEQGTA
jgi:hypothetical protein